MNTSVTDSILLVMHVYTDILVQLHDIQVHFFQLLLFLNIYQDFLK